MGARGWTTLGHLGSAARAAIDPAGLIVPRPDGWSLDWWIGAEDRWHLPSREPSVRQRLIDLTPVVETAMRIPGGDAVHRAFAVPDRDWGDLVVVEIENCSAVPFAVALGLGPFNPEAPVLIGRIELRDERLILVDGRPALLLPRPPSGLALTDLRGGGVVAAVMNDPQRRDDAVVRCRAGRAEAAVVYPLAHRALLRVAVLLNCGRVSRRARIAPFPDRLPSAAAAARGWDAQARRGLRLNLPEGRLADAVEANRRALLLSPAADACRETAATVAALDRYGFHPEAAGLLRSFPARQRRDGRYVGPDGAADGHARVMTAMADHWRLTGDRELLEELRPGLAAAAKWTQRLDGWTVSGLLGVADLLEAVGDTDGAARARTMASSQAREDLASEAGRALEVVRSMVGAASGTFTWPDSRDHASATFLIHVRDLLVRDVVGRGVALCSGLPEEWEGRDLEVHDAPTAAGTLSFALRWHGPRPSVLWELVQRGVEPVRLTAPGLDPQWSSTEVRGDALLAARAGVRS